MVEQELPQLLPFAAIHTKIIEISTGFKLDSKCGPKLTNKLCAEMPRFRLSIVIDGIPLAGGDISARVSCKLIFQVSDHILNLI
jgi:hypothetical protein